MQLQMLHHLSNPLKILKCSKANAKKQSYHGEIIANNHYVSVIVLNYNEDKIFEKYN